LYGQATGGERPQDGDSFGWLVKSASRWRQVAADPAVPNTASWRALEKAGFRFAGIVAGSDGPADGGRPHRGRLTPRV